MISATGVYFHSFMIKPCLTTQVGKRNISSTELSTAIVEKWLSFYFHRVSVICGDCELNNSRKWGVE